MRNIQLIIAYDGTDFHGWQRQGDLRTVQRDIERVLCRIAKHPVNLIASGRTDAGVHAVGQVANFFTTATMPAERLCHAVGKRLDADVAVVAARDVPADFHATLSAVSKLYRYRICNTRTKPVALLQQRYMYHYWKPLDVGAMQAAARFLIGRHNFKSLASSKAERRSYVRTIHRLTVERHGDEIRLDVQGDGFLYNQVRNIAGTLIDVGRGRWTPDHMPTILAAQDRSTAGTTAPPGGLCLQWVEYPPDHALPPRRAGECPQP